MAVRRHWRTRFLQACQTLTQTQRLRKERTQMSDTANAIEVLKGSNPLPEPTQVSGPAKPEDLSYDLAYRAHSGTSFSPEKRAKSAQQGYADDVNNFYQELLKLCTNDRQRLIVD